MKRVSVVLMVLLTGAALVFAGCGGIDAEQKPEQVQEQQEQQEQTSQQQNAVEQNSENEANPAGADIQNGQINVLTLQGEFQGLADGHSAEIIVDEEPVVFQFYEENVAELLNIMETGTDIQFDITVDAQTGVRTIVKVYENIE